MSTNEKVAALTFDDGPHPESTPRLLEILAKHGAHATFFMVGKAAAEYPDLVRHVAEAGHEIGNHSWDHPAFPLINRRERRKQLRACANALAPYGSMLFRPPYCEQSFASRLDALWLGYEVIMFDCEAGDWFVPDTSPIVTALAERTKPGSIICLHDALFTEKDFSLEPPLNEDPHHDREAMLSAVDLFLERSNSEFRFVTVADLLRLGEPERRIWYWDRREKRRPRV